MAGPLRKELFFVCCGFPYQKCNYAVSASWSLNKHEEITPDNWTRRGVPGFAVGFPLYPDRWVGVVHMPDLYPSHNLLRILRSTCLKQSRQNLVFANKRFRHHQDITHDNIFVIYRGSRKFLFSGQSTKRLGGKGLLTKENITFLTFFFFFFAFFLICSISFDHKAKGGD